SSSNIGNQQYTIGFYPWQHDSLYERNISVGTGTLINPAQCYQVNDNGPAGDVNYNWDLDQSFAVTNASNTGKDILSAWCNGMFIEAKYSNPNVMAFRSIPLGGLPLHGKVGDVFLYPQPGTNILNVENGKTGTGYQVVDMNGKNVANGQLNESAQIDISSMSSGVYLLYINGKSLKFTKK
ncbi:MAG: T9SS type A sorting domain-containing protein, partial [Chitinophagaceae bacterium]